MKTIRAILLGVGIWFIAVTFYAISYHVPFLENLDQQANIVLFIIVMPLVWLGCYYYYKQDKTTHGYKIGQVMLLTAVILDASITVPVFVIPNGGSHYSFFTSINFWIIALEFIATAVLYWYTVIYPKTLTENT